MRNVNTFQVNLTQAKGLGDAPEGQVKITWVYILMLYQYERHFTSKR
ncbi:hypothetical protein GCM10007931_17970 [Vibrio algivorus]|uniref:Uncharacterized protein n=1 Tax=Vibrio algivorus TaxID=1667024 RepID=A0ABQ6EPH4_9VIBR|nr:hypothetical protein GCM10007931_17970 [Vibrio algivorus]